MMLEINALWRQPSIRYGGNEASVLEMDNK